MATTKKATKKAETTKKKAAPKKASTKKAAPKKAASKKAAVKKSTPKKAAKKTGDKTNKLGVENSLVNNINARKKKGAARPKKKSTVSKESYERMEENWEDKK